MSIDNQIQFVKYEDLRLDPINPRLGRSWGGYDRTQNELLERMRDWDLEEIALSYLSGGGFWVQEALIVVEEEYLGERCLIVVEGNRRLAALCYLKQAIEGNPQGVSANWGEFIKDYEVSEDLFERVPYLLAGSRSDVNAFLGFRHVSGIKQWDAEEKAGFISKQIDDNDLSFVEMARQIGSLMPAVKRHYIAFKVLQQIERDIEFIDKELTSRRFALLYMSLNTIGAKNYLGINDCFEKTGKIDGDIVAPEKENSLEHFSRWVFGEQGQSPLVRNTNLVPQFGKIMESSESIKYLESSSNPRFEIATKLSGGLQEELQEYLNEAGHNIQLALMSIHKMKGNEEVVEAYKSLKSDFEQLSTIMEA